jgi:hypothetical protein
VCPPGVVADKLSAGLTGAARPYAGQGGDVPRLTGPRRLTHVSGMRASLAGFGLVLLGCSTAPTIEPPAPAPASPAVEPAPAPALALTPVTPGPRPISTPEISEARVHAQRRILGRQGSEPAAPREPPPPGQPPPVPADSLGKFLLIEDPAPDRPALARFHAALRDLAAGRDADGKVRVAMYGASGTAADIFTGYVRAYLQRRFGAGGPASCRWSASTGGTGTAR